MIKLSTGWDVCFGYLRKLWPVSLSSEYAVAAKLTIYFSTMASKCQKDHSIVCPAANYRFSGCILMWLGAFPSLSPVTAKHGSFSKKPTGEDFHMQASETCVHPNTTKNMARSVDFKRGFPSESWIPLEHHGMWLDWHYWFEINNQMVFSWHDGGKVWCALKILQLKTALGWKSGVLWTKPVLTFSDRI